MDITVKTGSVLGEESDLGVLATFEDVALPDAVANLLEPADYRGRAGQTLLLYPRGAVSPRRLLLVGLGRSCLLYTSPSPRDRTRSRMPSSA